MKLLVIVNQMRVKMVITEDMCRSELVFREQAATTGGSSGSLSHYRDQRILQPP